jgi:hypothetical protein
VYRFLALVIFLLLAACAPAATPTADLPTEQPAATQPPAPQATLSPTPTVPLVMLVLPEDMAHTESQLYQSTVYELAEREGWRFQLRNKLAPEDFEPGLRVVIAFPPDPGISALAAAAPDVQFLAVNIVGVTPAANLSVVGAGGSRPDQVAFLAGYMAAILANDWRVGVVIEKDTTEGANTRTAFRNGVELFCGLCNPSSGPFLDYPLAIEIPLDERPAAFPAYGKWLTDRRVEVVYVPASLAKRELLEFFTNEGVAIISPVNPTETASRTWVATIQPDLVFAIRSAWAQLVAGQGGMDVPSPYSLTSINPDILTPGKQRLAQEMLTEILAGRIDTGVR